MSAYYCATPSAAVAWLRAAFGLWLPLQLLLGWQPAHAAGEPAPLQRPALTVTTVSPERVEWPLRLAGSGNIAAWQEVVVASEVGGWRLMEVAAQVGDVVRRGQLLARLSTDTLQADLEQTRASLLEMRAMQAEAVANADRARELKPTGVLSLQQTQQILTAEATAKARVVATEARLQAAQLRLAQARIVAPDDGIISARSAVEGAVAQPGQELFRLIRRGRLEWRAELASADLGKLRPGLSASLVTPGGQTVKGTVRVVAPTVDATTRNGQVLVDLQPGSDARPGMFARGEIEVGQASALVLPQAAVIARDGFHHVMRLEAAAGAEARVALTKVTVGRRSGERVELTGGLGADARVVASGGAFLADGDLVKVVPGSPGAAHAPAAPAVAASASARR